MLTRRRLIALLALTILAGTLTWPHRREVLEFLAPPEDDYVVDQALGDGYGRASADLSAAWSVPLEPGYGGAEVFDRKAYVLDRESGVGDTLRVIDALTGAPLWTFSYEVDSPFGGMQAVYQMCATDSGKVLAGCQPDSTILAWPAR